MTPNNFADFHVPLADAETKATIWGFAAMNHVANHLEHGTDCITLNEQMQFMTVFYICLIEFKAWWGAFDIPELQITIK